MSEKYSTDELVNYLLPAEGLGVRLLLPPEVSDAIISRLRAADKLCGAIKEMMNEGVGYHKVRKAIADYKGKEES